MAKRISEKNQKTAFWPNICNITYCRYQTLSFQLKLLGALTIITSDNTGHECSFTVCFNVFITKLIYPL